MTSCNVCGMFGGETDDYGNRYMIKTRHSYWKNGRELEEDALLCVKCVVRKAAE